MVLHSLFQIIVCHLSLSLSSSSVLLALFFFFIFCTPSQVQDIGWPDIIQSLYFAPSLDVVSMSPIIKMCCHSVKCDGLPSHDTCHVLVRTMFLLYTLTIDSSPWFFIWRDKVKGVFSPHQYDGCVFLRLKCIFLLWAPLLVAGHGPPCVKIGNASWAFFSSLPWTKKEISCTPLQREVRCQPYYFPFPPFFRRLFTSNR